MFLRFLISLSFVACFQVSLFAQNMPTSSKLDIGTFDKPLVVNQAKPFEINQSKDGWDYGYIVSSALICCVSALALFFTARSVSSANQAAKATLQALSLQKNQNYLARLNGLIALRDYYQKWPESYKSEIKSRVARELGKVEQDLVSKIAQKVGDMNLTKLEAIEEKIEDYYHQLIDDNNWDYKKKI